MINEFDAFRDLEPDFAQGHSRGGIGGADTGAKRADEAVGASMRISSGHHVTGNYQPLLR